MTVHHSSTEINMAVDTVFLLILLKDIKLFISQCKKQKCSFYFSLNWNEDWWTWREPLLPRNSTDNYHCGTGGHCKSLHVDHHSVEYRCRCAQMNAEMSRLSWSVKHLQSPCWCEMQKKHHFALTERVSFGKASNCLFPWKGMGKSHRTEAMMAESQVQIPWSWVASYSIFLTFLLRAPSLSSSLVLRGEDAATAGGWWWSSSEPPRGEPNSRKQTQDSMRVKGEPWECRAVMTTWTKRM